jgi:hypothetical protein
VTVAVLGFILNTNPHAHRSTGPALHHQPARTAGGPPPGRRSGPRPSSSLIGEAPQRPARTRNLLMTSSLPPRQPARAAHPIPPGGEMAALDDLRAGVSELIRGHQRFTTPNAAAPLGLAEHLKAGSLTADQLPDAIGATQPRSLIRLPYLLGLVGITAGTHPDDPACALTPAGEAPIADVTGGSYPAVVTNNDERHRSAGDEAADRSRHEPVSCSSRSAATRTPRASSASRKPGCGARATIDLDLPASAPDRRSWRNPILTPVGARR